MRRSEPTGRGLANLVAALWLACSSAAADSPRFEGLGIDTELPGYTVWDVSQDNSGFVWMATVDGLVRFDGGQLVQYGAGSQDGALRDRFARVVHVDVGGQVWIGTDSGGLSRLSGERKFETYRHSLANEHSLNSDRVLALASADEQTLWIGTDNGLARLDVASGNVDRWLARPDDPTALADSYVRSVLVSEQGGVWVGTRRGLQELDLRSQQLRSIAPETLSTTVLSLHEASDKTVWIATTQGVYRYDPRTQSLTEPVAPLQGKTVVAIEETAEHFWFGTLGAGLFRVDLTRGMVNNYRYSGRSIGLPDNDIVSLHVDRSGVLWIGTFDAGIARLDTRSLAFGRQDDADGSVSCLESCVVYGFHLDQGGPLWLATDRGAARFDKAAGLCEVFAADVDAPQSLANGVLSMARSSDGTLWLGTMRGLARFNDQLGQVERVPSGSLISSVYFIHEKTPGQLVLGTRQGLYYFDTASGDAQQVIAADRALVAAVFTDVDQDADGRLWFATDAGIAYLDDRGQLQSLAVDFDGALRFSVTALHVAADGKLWAGVASQGLWHIDRSGRVLQKLTEDDGFPVTLTVAAIVADRQGHLWVSTLAGLARVDTEASSVRVYNASDGLQGNKFSLGAALAAPSGALYFGGRTGFNAFFPSDIRDNDVPPPVALTQLRLRNDVVAPGQAVDGLLLEESIETLDELVLSHRHQMFSIAFAGLDFAAPQRNRYAYRMDGFDPQWRYTTAAERRATYTNLDPGNYRFSVRAANKDGVWNEAERSLIVRILPPWWATLWARLLYALLAVTLVGFIVRLRGAAQLRYAQSLEREVAQRTREVEHQKQVIENILSRRNELFENVSHEFRTPLTLMIGPLEQLERDLEQEDAPAKIELALTNAKRLLRMVEQLLTLSEVTADTAMPQRARPLRPVVYMQLAAFAQAAQENGIDLVAGEMVDDSVLMSQDGLETILGNLISNAIKYSGHGSRVRVQARRLDDRIEIVVEDNGPGINAADAEHVFQRFGRLRHHASLPGSGLGLAVTKEVVEANGGSIRCERGSDGGAAFVVLLPRSDTVLPAAQYVESQRVLPRAVHDTWIEPTVSDAETFADDPGTPVEQAQRRRVLVIDDSPDILAYVGDVLAPHFEVIKAANGQEGIECARTDVPDAIVCDIMMPDMDGFAVSKDLRGNQITSHIPILLLTARGDRGSRLRAWTETADEYLQKPFDAEELRLRLQNLISIRDMLRANLSQQLDEDVALSAMTLQGKDLEFMQRLDGVLTEGFAGLNFNRQTIAAAMAISERQLQRKLKALTGRNPSEYLRDFRLRAAKEQLHEGTQVALVAERCGFSSASYFVKCFREKYGTTPKKYQAECEARSRA